MSDVRHSLTIRLVDRSSDGSGEDRTYTVSGVGDREPRVSTASEIAMSLMEACHAFSIEPAELAADLLKWCQLDYLQSEERDLVPAERSSLFEAASTYLEARKQALSRLAEEAMARCAQSDQPSHPFKLRR